MIPFGLAIGILAGRFSPKENQEALADKKEKKEKKPSAAKEFKLLADSKEALRNAQDTLETVASYLERIRNTFKWILPFSSIVLLIAVIIISVVLFLVPLRTLLSVWGINKVCYILGPKIPLGRAELTWAAEVGPNFFPGQAYSQINSTSST